MIVSSVVTNFFKSFEPQHVPHALYSNKHLLVNDTWICREFLNGLLECPWQWTCIFKTKKCRTEMYSKFFRRFALPELLVVGRFPDWLRLLSRAEAPPPPFPPGPFSRHISIFILLSRDLYLYIYMYRPIYKQATNDAAFVNAWHFVNWIDSFIFNGKILLPPFGFLCLPSRCHVVRTKVH